METPPTPVSPAASPAIVPNTGIPKTLGLLNIIFGSLLLMVLLFYALQLAMLPLLGALNKGIQKMQEDVASRAQARQQATATEAEGADAPQADGQGESGATEGEEGSAPNAVEELPADERAAPPPTPRPQIMPMMPMGEFFEVFANPWVIGQGIVDCFTGIVLNIVMIVAGVGLRRLRSWGRKLALWTAGLKIGRLVALNAFSLLVTLPIVTQALKHSIAQAPGVAPSASGPAPFAQMYEIMLWVQALITFLLASVYPFICLWLLRGPAVKAACQAPKAPDVA